MGSAGGYELVPVVKTPSVRPGERVRIDVYCTGAGVPSGTELRVGCDAALVSSEDQGEGQVPNLWVASHGAAEGDAAARPEPVATDGGTDVETPGAGSRDEASDHGTGGPAAGDADRVTRTVSLNPVRFERSPTPDAAGDEPSYTVSETPTRFAPPAQVEILTDERCPAGEYEIPFSFSYPDGGSATETVTVRVGSFGQRLRSRAASGAALGAGLLGAATPFL